MSGQRYYRVHGLVLVSAVELPIPEIEPQTADLSYSIQLEGEARAEPWHSRPDDQEMPWAIDHWIDDRLIVEFANVTRFEVSRDAIVLLRDASDDPDGLAHMLLDEMVPRVVALRGDLMMHAAGVQGPGGGAHIFLGESRAGKSTLATALATSGWPILDDDGIRVTMREGIAYAVPGYAGVRLFPDSAAAVLAGAKPGPPLMRGHSKHRFAVESDQLPMAQHPAPVTGVYILNRCESGEPRVEPLGFLDAIGCLLDHACHIADRPELIARRDFELASLVASVVPVWQLTYPAGTAGFKPTARLLSDLESSR